MSSCSTLNSNTNPKEVTTQAAIESGRIELEKIFSQNSPLKNPASSRFPIHQTLPGALFKPSFDQRINFDEKGNLQLKPGDYIIPVMTYCLWSSGASPSRHLYYLSQLRGTRAALIREINLKATPQFSYQDVQILLWSLQNGLKYSELTKESQKIIDEVAPQYKEQLKESFLEVFTKKWDEVADRSFGKFPKFEELSQEVLIGDIEKAISEIKDFKSALEQFGNNYEFLRQRISIEKSSNQDLKEDTPWSQVAPNIYARFLAEGAYQELGQVQVRIVGSSRKINIDFNQITFDLLSLLADPNSSTIQPLGFSPLYGYGGVLIVPSLARAPPLALALMGSILAAEIVNWDSFHDLVKILSHPDESLRQKIIEGQQALSEKHDKLERPARDMGIINNKTKNTSSKPDNSTREYEKPGGQNALDEDFNKFPEPTKKVDKVEIKELLDGTKIVKRPKSKDGKPPTLEIQPEKISNNQKDPTRIKIRYK